MSESNESDRQEGRMWGVWAYMMQEGRKEGKVVCHALRVPGPSAVMQKITRQFTAGMQMNISC